MYNALEKCKLFTDSIEDDRLAMLEAGKKTLEQQQREGVRLYLLASKVESRLMLDDACGVMFCTVGRRCRGHCELGQVIGRWDQASSEGTESSAATTACCLCGP